MFDFDEWIERADTDSDKWHKYAGRGIIPLWVADMDFRSPPAVIQALQARLQHGVFGYGYPSPQLAELFVQRMADLYGWQIKPEWLVFLPGLVCGLNLSVRAFTEAGQGTLCPHPVYPPFMSSSRLAGRSQCQIPLVESQGRWVPDLETAERNLTGSEKLLMLCNPQNPGGTVYRREELEAQLAFAQRHDLLVCSDEIHCDLLLEPAAHHIPFAALNEDAAQRSVILMAPSKTFNIAGLGASIAVIANDHLHARFVQTRTGIVPSVDILAYVAATAAYRDGQPWLNDLLDYLRGNRDLVSSRLNALPGLSILPGMEATYLAWINCSGLPVQNPHAFFEQAGVGLSPGRDFGNPRFVRLNFGCRRQLLEQALERMEKAVHAL